MTVLNTLTKTLLEVATLRHSIDNSHPETVVPSTIEETLEDVLREYNIPYMGEIYKAVLQRFMNGEP